MKLEKKIIHLPISPPKMSVKDWGLRAFTREVESEKEKVINVGLVKMKTN